MNNNNNNNSSSSSDNGSTQPTKFQLSRNILTIQQYLYYKIINNKYQLNDKGRINKRVNEKIIIIIG